MKHIIVLAVYLISFNLYALEHNSCTLEKYFINTVQYKSSLLNDKEKKLELDRQKLSLFPSVYMSMGQESNNNRSFKSVGESSLFVGVSQTIYEGGSYVKYKKKINSDLEYNHLMILDKRNSYLIDLYREVINYKYKLDLLELYASQLDKQNIQLEADKASLDSGDLAMIEYNASSLRRDEIRNNLSLIRNEIRQLELDIYHKFNIPVGYIKNISGETILSCKKDSTGDILMKSRALLHENEYTNYELEMTSLQPNVTFSMYISPPNTGTWNDLSMKKIDFGASVNVSIPVNKFFSLTTIEKNHAIAVSRINNDYDEKEKLFWREKEKIISEMNGLENSVVLSRTIVALKGKEVDYVLDRFKHKKETILNYYRQLDEYESAKLKLKKEEREIEFNKVYISILG